MITKGQAITLFRNLNQLGDLRGVKFTYCISKNLNLLKPELESIEKSVEMSDKFKEFENERVELVEKYAEKDDKGKAKKEIGKNGAEQYIMGTDEKKFEKEFEALKAKHKEAMDLREKQIEEYTKLLATASEVTLYTLKLDDVPAEITTKQMAGLYDIVEEEK